MNPLVIISLIELLTAIVENLVETLGKQNVISPDHPAHALLEQLHDAIARAKSEAARALVAEAYGGKN